jgi:metallophosphoesterase (TIGR00282 family)
MNSGSQSSYPGKPGNAVRIIFLGDVVGRPGRTALKKLLQDLRDSVGAELVIVNGENAAGGAGIDPGTGHELRSAGADVVTLGDHAFQRKGAAEFLNENSKWCIRPANLPADTTPGKGECSIALPDGTMVHVINLLGRVFISGIMECPFRAIQSWLATRRSEGSGITVCDFHAEATSEKYAMARHVDGKLSLLVGTHTHVQTADAQVLPGGTGYITDLGMTGNQGGVIGMQSDVALQRFLSPRPAPYQVAEGDGELRGVIADIDRASGRALGVYLVK